MDEISGCDFSSWSDDMDYAIAKSRMRFAFIRVSQGISLPGHGFPVNGFKDRMFDKHWEGMRGCPRSATHFLDWARIHYTVGKEIEFGRAQADCISEILSKEPGEIVPSVDYENNDPAKSTWGSLNVLDLGRTNKIFLACCLRLKENFGKFPIVYTPGWVAKTLKNAIEGILWMPRYQSNSEILQDFLTWEQLRLRRLPESGAWPTLPTGQCIIPAGWRFWQYSSGGVGYNFGLKSKASWARMDLNIFNGTEQDFSVVIGDNSIPTYPPETEEPPQQSEYTKAIVIAPDGVNVRSGIGTVSPQWYLSGLKYVLPKNSSLDILDIHTDSSGNRWIRSGFNQYECVKFGDVELMKLV
jgi:GH25 family lysozyme M1 (1,4-beta-N-acetylmuramidase)